MNANRFTQKSLEAIQGAQQFADANRNTQVEQVHLLKTLIDEQDDLNAQLLNSMQIDVPALRGAVDRAIDALATYSGDGQQSYAAPTISRDSAADSDGKGKGFIVPENALAVVNRVVKPAKGAVGGLVEYGEMTDEVSGITLTERVVVDAGRGENGGEGDRGRDHPESGAACPRGTQARGFAHNLTGCGQILNAGKKRWNKAERNSLWHGSCLCHNDRKKEKE